MHWVLFLGCFYWNVFDVTHMGIVVRQIWTSTCKYEFYVNSKQQQCT